MKDNNESVVSVSGNGHVREAPAREPLFRRYQIQVKAGVRTGAVPTGRPPIGF